MDPWNKRMWLDPITVVFATLFVVLIAACNWYWSNGLLFGIVAGAGVIFVVWFLSLFIMTIGREE